MTATMTNCPVRIEWREDGRYGYRDTDLGEIRGSWVGHPVGLYTRLTASTPTREIWS